MNTSERIDALRDVSDQIYPIFLDTTAGELRAKTLLRQAIGDIALALDDGYTVSHAGRLVEQRVFHALRDINFGPFQSTHEYASQLTAPPNSDVPDDIAWLADAYAETERKTMLATGMFEPDSIHALHLTAMNHIYVEHFYPILNLGAVAANSCSHDIVEAYTGDVATYGLPQSAIDKKKRDDEQGLEHFEDKYGKLWPGLVALVIDYEHGKTSEARFVRANDKNDPWYTHALNQGLALREVHSITTPDAFLEGAKQGDERLAILAQEFPFIYEDRVEINSRIAAFFR